MPTLNEKMNADWIFITKYNDKKVMQSIILFGMWVYLVRVESYRCPEQPNETQKINVIKSNSWSNSGKLFVSIDNYEVSW